MAQSLQTILDRAPELGRIALEEAGEAVLVITLADLNIFWAGGAAEELLGAPLDEIIFQPYTCLVPSEPVAGLLSFDPRWIWQSGRYGELAIERFDGGVAIVSMIVHRLEEQSLAVLRLRDASAGAGLARDLRRVLGELSSTYLLLKEQERALAEARRAASLAMFAAGLAHELNNPLGIAVSGTSTLGSVADELEEEAGGPRPATTDLREITADLKVAHERMARVVKGLGEMEEPTRRESFDAVALLRRAAGHAAGLADELPAALPMTSDPGALEGLVDRLLANARRAAGVGGRVRLSASVHGAELIVRIEDDGPGVPSELSERIFDPFFTTQPPGAGLGLGLFLARRAAGRLGGELTLERLQPRGARFELRLPTLLAEAAPAHTAGSYEALRSR